MAAILGAFDQDFLPLPPVRLARIVGDMCGIAGIYARPDAEAPQELLPDDGRGLRRRGPTAPASTGTGAGMTNNRLAIVDLEGGDQPLASEDGRYWVMQNGEIYNYVELRAELETLGRLRRPATPR